MDIGEAIAVAAVSHDDKQPCWYCEEPGNPKRKNYEDAEPNTSDSESEDAIPENDENNVSSKLGVNLGGGKEWTITCPHKNKDTMVISAAHHLIPGNASLKKATALHRFMKEGGPFNLESDIGYGVNHKKNGVWLPGNYGVRKDKGHYDKNWGAYDDSFKDEYAIRTMKQSGVQFHDAHPEYSENVLNTLQDIASKLGKPKSECAICKKPVDKQRPPYGLVGRLDFVSSEHRTMITTMSERGKEYVNSGYFTSSRVKKIFGLT